MEEFWPLVEVRGVVLVPLDHEVPPLPEPVAHGEVLRDPSHEERRVGSEVEEGPGGERRGRRLPVRPRHDDRFPLPDEEARDRLGHRQRRHAAPDRLLRLRVSPRHRVPHDHQIRVRRDVLRRVRRGEPDAEALELRAHRRVDVRVGSGDPAPLLLQHPREGSHPHAARRDQVNVHRPAISFQTASWIRGRSACSFRLPLPNTTRLVSRITEISRTGIDP